jgi:hypothetical protein
MSYFDGRSWHQHPDSSDELEDTAVNMPTSIVAYLDIHSESMEFNQSMMTITQTGDQTDINAYIPYFSFSSTAEDIFPYTAHVWFFDVPYSIAELMAYSEHLGISELLNEYARSIAPGRYTQIDPATAIILRHIAREAGIDFGASLFADSYDPDASRFALAGQVAAFVSSAADYSLNPRIVPSGEDFVVYFLENSQMGYCIHFATTAALMLRAFGVPARFVSGFIAYIPADQVGEVVSVTDRFAHAWAEVFLEDFGWVPLEATPATGLSVVPAISGQNVGIGMASDLFDDIHFDLLDEFGDWFDYYMMMLGYHDLPAGAAAEVPGTLTNFALLIIILACAAAFFAVRTVIFKLRHKSFKNTDTNMAAINIWKYLIKLSRKEQISADIELLALKARFSKHNLAEHEREQMIRYAQDFRDEIFMTETFPIKLWLRLRAL